MLPEKRYKSVIIWAIFQSVTKHSVTLANALFPVNINYGQSIIIPWSVYIWGYFKIERHNCRKWDKCFTMSLNCFRFLSPLTPKRKIDTEMSLHCITQTEFSSNECLWLFLQTDISWIRTKYSERYGACDYVRVISSQRFSTFLLNAVNHLYPIIFSADTLEK